MKSMRIKQFNLAIGIIIMILIASCEKDQLDKTYNSVELSKLITVNESTIDTLVFDYNKDGLLIKYSYTGSTLYYTNEYDEWKQLIRNNSYNGSGLYHYFTIQYNTDTITKYFPFIDEWGTGDVKVIHVYNSNSECERVNYYYKKENEDWQQSDYELYTWKNNNITEIKHYSENELDYTVTYYYDDKKNPEQLLNYMTSPITKTKNNIISSSTLYSNGSEIVSTFEYEYNDYEYPKIKTCLEGNEPVTKYEYKFN